jgi:hypothetical protein
VGPLTAAVLIASRRARTVVAVTRLSGFVCPLLVLPLAAMLFQAEPVLWALPGEHSVQAVRSGERLKCVAEEQSERSVTLGRPFDRQESSAASQESTGFFLRPISDLLRTPTATQVGDSIPEVVFNRRQRQPLPIKLPRTSIDHELRFSTFADLVVYHGKYLRETRVDLAESQRHFVVSDRTNTPGLSATIELRLPDGFRRVTIGSMFGITTWKNRVRSAVPANISVPFSREILDWSIYTDNSRRGDQQGYISRALISPYIEHDIIPLDHQLSRFRIGYQYWTQPTLRAEGSFSQPGRASILYLSEDKYRTHMLRAVWDFIYGDDEDELFAFHFGVLVGRNGGVVGFVGVGAHSPHRR